MPYLPVRALLQQNPGLSDSVYRNGHVLSLLLDAFDEFSMWLGHGVDIMIRIIRLMDILLIESITYMTHDDIYVD